MILNHSAGLPIKNKVKDGGFLDWDYMVRLIENEKLPNRRELIPYDDYGMVDW